MSQKSAKKRNSPEAENRQSHSLAEYQCEVEVAEGLESVAKNEIRQRLDPRALFDLTTHKGALQFGYSGELKELLHLKTVIAAYVMRHYDLPRPRALLGHEHFHNLLKLVDAAFSPVGKTAYKTLYLNAAGADSSVMRRLKQEIADQTGLQVNDDEGDLLIRVRRAKSGWDVLVRLSPRPLATRQWRVCDMEGALNASVAHAMLQLIPHNENDVFLNLLCGSGTLMIERLSFASAQKIMGCEVNPAALACARENIQAAGYNDQMALILADARELPFANNSVDSLCADLPFGQLVGSHDENRRLYPQVLQEAARIARSGAVFLVITHEVRLIESVLVKSALWRIEKVHRITLRGLHPRIYVLRKR